MLQSLAGPILVSPVQMVQLTLRLETEVHMSNSDTRKYCPRTNTVESRFGRAFGRSWNNFDKTELFQSSRSAVDDQVQVDGYNDHYSSCTRVQNLKHLFKKIASSAPKCNFRGNGQGKKG